MLRACVCVCVCAHLYKAVKRHTHCINVIMNTFLRTQVQIKVISDQYMRTAARCQHRDSYPIHFAIEASSTYQSPHMGRWVPVTAGLDPLCWLPSLPDSRVPPGCHWQHKTCDWGQPHNGAHLMPPRCRAPTGQAEHMCSRYF